MQRFTIFFFLLGMEAHKSCTVHVGISPFVLLCHMLRSKHHGMICILGNAPTLVPCSVWTSQGCMALGDRGNVLVCDTICKSRDPASGGSLWVCCVFGSLLSMPSSRGITYPMVWHGLWSPMRLCKLGSRRGAAELRVCEIQAAAREPESAVGCGTLTLGG